MTDCIIRGIHESNHHAGIQSTLAALRQKFWVLETERARYEKSFADVYVLDLILTP